MGGKHFKFGRFVQWNPNLKISSKSQYFDNPAPIKVEFGMEKFTVGLQQNAKIWPWMAKGLDLEPPKFKVWSKWRYIGGFSSRRNDSVIIAQGGIWRSLMHAKFGHICKGVATDGRSP